MTTRRDEVQTLVDNAFPKGFRFATVRYGGVFVADAGRLLVTGTDGDALKAHVWPVGAEMELPLLIGQVRSEKGRIVLEGAFNGADMVLSGNTLDPKAAAADRAEADDEYLAFLRQESSS